MKRIAAFVTVKWLALAHFSKSLCRSLGKDIDLDVSTKVSKVLLWFEKKNLSQRFLMVSWLVTNKAIVFITSSCVRLKTLTLSVTYSLISILKFFYKQFKKPFQAYRRYYVSHYLKYKGVAIVSGIEYLPYVGEAVKSLINKYNFRATSLNSAIQALHGEPEILTPLFLKGITKEEMGKLKEIKDIILSSEKADLHFTINLIRAKLGRLFLIKKNFNPRIFTIFSYVLTADEALFLKNNGYFLLYLQSNNPAYLSKFDRGLTFGATRYDEYKFEDVTVEYLTTLFESILTGVRHR